MFKQSTHSIWFYPIILLTILAIIYIVTKNCIETFSDPCDDKFPGSYCQNGTCHGQIDWCCSEDNVFPRTGKDCSTSPPDPPSPPGPPSPPDPPSPPSESNCVRDIQSAIKGREEETCSSATNFPGYDYCEVTNAEACVDIRGKIIDEGKDLRITQSCYNPDNKRCSWGCGPSVIYPEIDEQPENCSDWQAAGGSICCDSSNDDCKSAAQKIANVCTFSSTVNPATDDHPGLDFALWHEGYPDIVTKGDPQEQLKRFAVMADLMVAFVKYRRIKRVFLQLFDPNTGHTTDFKAFCPEYIVECFLRKIHNAGLTDSVEICAILNVNPKYDGAEFAKRQKMRWPDGTTAPPLRGGICGEQQEVDIICPGNDGSPPDSSKLSDNLDSGSHLREPFVDADATKGGHCTSSGWTGGAGFKKGCPNNIEQLFFYLSYINKLAKKWIGDNSPVFVGAAFDGEDYGAYGADFYGVSQAAMAASEYLRPSLSQNQTIYLGWAQNMGLNPEALCCPGKISNDGCSSPEEAQRHHFKFDPQTGCIYNDNKKSGTIQIETFPELYWVGELKQAVKCGDPLACPTTQIAEQSQCPNNSVDCVKPSGCQSSDDCGGCFNCYKSIYQTHLGKPENMLNDWNKQGLDFNDKTLMKYFTSAGEWPMFSFERAHNIKNPDGGLYNTCISRIFGDSSQPKENAHICGTFDGFGSWSWDQFVDFLKAFQTKVNKHSNGKKLTKVGLYEWQFVPPQWLPPGWEDCLKQSGLKSGGKEGFSVIHDKTYDKTIKIGVVILFLIVFCFSFYVVR